MIRGMHHVACKSIYSRHPNHLKMELTNRIHGAETLARHEREARKLLDDYTQGARAAAAATE